VSNLVKVKATSIGVYGGSRVRPGQVFEVPEGFTGSWFEPAPDDRPVAEQVADAVEALKNENAAEVDESEEVEVIDEEDDFPDLV